MGGDPPNGGGVSDAERFLVTACGGRHNGRMSEQRARIGDRQALGAAVRPRSGRPRPAPVRDEAPEALWSEEVVGAAWLVAVIGPILVAVAGSYYVFVAGGAACGAALLVLLTAALPASGTDEADAGLPASGALAAMAVSLVLAMAKGGHWWAVPAIVVPAGVGWLALLAGLADHGPPPGGDRPASRGPHPGLMVAYAAFVIVVMALLLAWFSGTI